jgi:hypothetical protein
MILSPKLRQHIFQDLRAAVDHQGILSDIIVPLAELRVWSRIKFCVGYKK